MQRDAVACDLRRLSCTNCVPEHKMQRERKHKMLLFERCWGLLYHAGVSAENLSSDDLGHEMQQGLEHKM